MGWNHQLDTHLMCLYTLPETNIAPKNDGFQ